VQRTVSDLILFKYYWDFIDYHLIVSRICISIMEDKSKESKAEGRSKAGTENYETQMKLKVDEAGRHVCFIPSAAAGRNQGFEMLMNQPRAVSLQLSAVSF